MKQLDGFQRIALDAEQCIWIGHLPEHIITDNILFDELWQTHPDNFHQLKMFGRLVNAPRWQQAYEKDYRFTGTVSKAKPVEPLLMPFVQWAQDEIESALNGLLLNWYDSELRHYIGAHHDSTHNLLPLTPIVTISLGQDRIFRIRRDDHARDVAPIDLHAEDRSVFVMPWETNLAFKHEVPFRSEQKGRRISITLRAFQNQK